jgi:phosphoglycerate dehydrogenase-like enzyme
VTGPFRVGVTRDIRRPKGGAFYPLDALAASPDVSWEFLTEDVENLEGGHVDGYDAVIVATPRVSAATFTCSEPPLLFARLGVGYDRVDVPACTARGALVTITPESVRRPMATAAILFMLALAHRLPEKDRLLRSGRWELFSHVGRGLQGRVLGVLGLGGIGREICRLAEPFELQRIATDPYAAPLPGVQLVELETLLKKSDFLCVSCPLTDETRYVIAADQLSLMKREAYLINIARGPIVDQHALTVALTEKRIAGAALDVFEQEPIASDDPLLQLDNVILTPHGIGRTDQLIAATGRSACESALAVAAGRAPRHIVDPAALDHPRLKARIRR